jgi:signal transduction histidine kinase
MRRCVIGAIWLTLAFASSSATQPAARRVLIVYSSDLGFSSDAAFERAFRTELGTQFPEPINFFTVSVQPTASAGAIQEEAAVNYLRANFAGQRLDLVMTISGPAALFVRKYHGQLFPETPVVLAGVDQRWVKHEVLAPNEAAVPITIDPVRIVEDILRLLPGTANLFVVLGNSPFEKSWRAELIRDFAPFADRLTVTWFNDLSFAEMLKRSAALPASSALFYLVLSVDADGLSHSEDRVLAELHAAANAPMFGVFSSQLGSGVVGGPVLSIEDVAAHTANVGVRLLHGESAATITSASQAADRPTYDWRELQRWGISDARLPAGSLVLFRQRGVWDQYKIYIFSAAAIVVLQSVLIAGLVFQRIRRRRAELALRRSYEQNQDLAGRLINAQEVERARIARDLHDDVSQQLAGVAIMLSGLKRKVGAEPDVDRAFTALQDRTSTLAEAIRNLSHELHPSVLHTIGLATTLERYCAEVEELHHLEVIFRADDDLGALSADAELSLFRVAQEALTNAVRHARPRTIHVELMAASDSVELRVADDGVGFVTDERTGSGLGLRSMDERVRLAQGSVDIESRPGQGTSVLVRMPLAALPISVTGQA